MFGWQRCSYPRWENPRSAFKARTGSEVRQELVWMINNKQSEWQHTIRVSNTLKAYSCWVDPGLGAYLLFTGVTIQNWVNMEEGGAEREHLSSKPPSDQSSALCVHIHLLPALCTTRHSGVSDPNKGFPTVDDVHTFNNKGTNNSIFLLSVFKALSSSGSEDANTNKRCFNRKTSQRRCSEITQRRSMELQGEGAALSWCRSASDDASLSFVKGRTLTVAFAPCCLSCAAISFYTPALLIKAARISSELHYLMCFHCSIRSHSVARIKGRRGIHQKELFKKERRGSRYKRRSSEQIRCLSNIGRKDRQRRGEAQHRRRIFGIWKRSQCIELLISFAEL